MHADDLQSGVSVSNGEIAGTLNYVTGYTGFSGKAAEQSGNYLAIKVTGNADRVRVKLDPSASGLSWRTLDADRTIVLRIRDTNQKVLVEEKIGNETNVEEYSLKKLVLEPAE